MKKSCKKCGSKLNRRGFCKDLTCPHSDWAQSVPTSLLTQDLTTLDILDQTDSMGIGKAHRQYVDATDYRNQIQDIEDQEIDIGDGK